MNGDMTVDREMQGFIGDLARRAGDVLLRYFRSGALQSDPKGAWDLVTEADRASEALIIEAIRARFPDHDVFGEETGRSGATARMLWLIDPLDGTLNFSRGLPVWGVSVALAEENEVYYGAFFDPLHDELFYAQRGAGATVNGTPLHTSGVEELAQAVVNCAVAHGELAALTGRNAQRMWDRVMRLRMNGSVGSALANIAAGRMDAAIELRGGPWDYAAGGLLVREAGGYTSTFEGGPLVAEATTVLAAATPALHRRQQVLLCGGGEG
jgi:myo-inositol-1(or 4)-monophosphatase